VANTGRLPDLVAFVEGLRNGETYDESDIDELVENFGRFKGYWRPYVSVDHEQHPAFRALAFGDVTAARKGRVRLGPGGKWERTADADRRPGTKAALVLDAADVPTEVCELVNSGRLPRVSVEFFDHEAPFVGPDDEPVLTNVLKSVSLLGAQSEASKGMPRPVAVFADRVGRRVEFPRRAMPAKVKRFGAYAMRDQLLQALQAAGVDTSQLTDAVPDAVLQMLADALGQGPPADPAMMGDWAKKCMDGMPPEDAANWKAGMAKAFADDPDPDDDPKAKTFADRRTLDRLVADAVAKATAPLRDQLAVVGRSAARAKAAKVKAFRDQMTGAGGKAARMTPAQFDAVEPLLFLLDDATVRKFSDGKAEGTALDEQLARTAAAHATPVKTFGDRVPDPAAGQPGGTMTPERRAELLRHTPEGRLVLKTESAKK
jgi:hypothetical protein